VPRISRRRFIHGSVAALGLGSTVSLLNACGGSSSTNNQLLPDELQLVQRFPQVLVPGEVRLPISLAKSSGLVSSAEGFNFPSNLTAKIVDLSIDKVVIENVSAELHGADFAVPYYPFRVDIAEPGNYLLVVDSGPRDGAAFSVLEQSEVLVPKIGDDLPGFESPTFADSRGVTPVCTRLPEPCPFHQLTLTEALTRNMAVAYLVGTPAHCSTGTCAPALESLIQVAKEFGDRIAVVHAEVYTDDTATVVAPAVTALNMTFEPALFIADSEAKIVDRLDAVFDAKEISAALARAGV